MDLPPAHSPDEDYEEMARQSKRARHSKGESASASSPAKHAANPEVDDTGSSSPSAKEQAELQDPLNMDPLDSAPLVEFGRLPSVSLGSDEDKELR